MCGCVRVSVLVRVSAVRVCVCVCVCLCVSLGKVRGGSGRAVKCEGKDAEMRG